MSRQLFRGGEQQAPARAEGQMSSHVLRSRGLPLPPLANRSSEVTTPALMKGLINSPRQQQCLHDEPIDKRKLCPRNKGFLPPLLLLRAKE